MRTTNCLLRFSAHRIACLGSMLGIAVLTAARLNVDESPPTQPDNAATSKADQERIDCARHAQPIVKQHRLSCHGPDKQKSRYRLDVKSVAFAGGDFGEAPNAAPCERGAQSPEARSTPPRQQLTLTSSCSRSRFVPANAYPGSRH